MKQCWNKGIINDLIDLPVKNVWTDGQISYFLVERNFMYATVLPSRPRYHKVISIHDWAEFNVSVMSSSTNLLFYGRHG